MSIIIQECYLAIIHLFFSNSILNYFGSISIGNYLFCGSVWQEVHKLEHHWYICITCHDKDVGLEGNFQLSLYLMDEKTEIQKIWISWQRHLTESQSFHSLKSQWENEKKYLNHHFTELFNICNLGHESHLLRIILFPVSLPWLHSPSLSLSFVSSHKGNPVLRFLQVLVSWIKPRNRLIISRLSSNPGQLCVIVLHFGFLVAPPQNLVNYGALSSYDF